MSTLAQQMREKAMEVLKNRAAEKRRAMMKTLKNYNYSLTEKLEREIEDAASHGKFETCFNFKWWDQVDTLDACLYNEDGGIKDTGFLYRETKQILKSWIEKHGFIKHIALESGCYCVSW